MKKALIRRRKQALIRQKHFDRLCKLARRHHGVLPSYSWLNRHGFFGSYDSVRAAGMLKHFKRASAR